MIHFVLISHARSGSTLIVRSLAEHKNVRMFGELLNADEKERARVFSHRICWVARRLGINESMYYREGDDAAKFLDEKVFFEREYDEEVTAVGFKIFYRQARENVNVKKAWQYLFDNKQIHVIHLIRSNLLEAYLSLQLAVITNEWARLQGRDLPPPPEVPRIRLSPDECASYFDQIIAYRDWVRDSWSDHPMLELNYETDLCNNYDSAMSRLEDFVKVNHLPAEKQLEKQARRHPREQISNYDELKEYFRYTIHEQYFE